MGDEEQWYWNDWKEYQTEVKKDLSIIQEEWDEAFYNNKTTNNHTITFHSGPDEDAPEMLRVAEDGFYVRGVKVEADAKEAQQVYTAFKQWLTWNTLSTK